MGIDLGRSTLKNDYDDNISGVVVLLVTTTVECVWASQYIQVLVFNLGRPTEGRSRKHDSDVSMVTPCYIFCRISRRVYTETTNVHMVT